MEVDAGEPMLIQGIITQGRGVSQTHQFVTEFRIEYRHGDSLGSNIASRGTFLMTANARKNHLFDLPIFARYV